MESSYSRLTLGGGVGPKSWFRRLTPGLDTTGIPAKDPQGEAEDFIPFDNKTHKGSISEGPHEGHPKTLKR